MMHRCSSSCSCGMYNQSSDYSSGYSMFFATPNTNNNNNQINHNQYYDNQSIYSSSDYDNQSIYSSSSSSVDCTLSLGTPSTRLSTNANDRPPSESRRSLSSSHKSGRGGGTDPLVTRRCANCDTTSTPLWRNGPRGPKSLCNACGIRFKKEERRASAAAAAASANGGGAGGMDVMHNSWVPHQTQMPYNNYSSTSAAYGNEYGYMEDDDRDSAFLSWRLNVHCS